MKTIVERQFLRFIALLPATISCLSVLILNPKALEINISTQKVEIHAKQPLIESADASIAGDSLNQFIQKTQNTVVADPNGLYSGECVSLVKSFLSFLGLPNPSRAWSDAGNPRNVSYIAMSKFAQGENQIMDHSGIASNGKAFTATFISKVEDLQAGDVVATNYNPTTNSSHTGIATGYKDPNRQTSFEIYNANWADGVVSNPKMAHKSWISKSAFYGAIRIRFANETTLSAGVKTIRNPFWNKCLNLQNAYTDGVQPNVWGCASHPDQGWEVQDTGDGFVQIRNRSWNKCLNLQNANTDGVQPKIWGCAIHPDQQWKMEDAGNGLVRFKNRSWNKCLNLQNANIDGVKPNAWGCASHPDQAWKIEDAGNAGNVLVKIKNRAWNKCLNIQNANTDGVRPNAWGCAWHQDQGWEVKDAGDGFVQIRNRFWNKCLNLQNANTDGVKPNVWGCAIHSDQQWKMEDAGDGFVRFRNRSWNKCLNLQNANTDGVQPNVWGCAIHPDQSWKMEN